MTSKTIDTVTISKQSIDDLIEQREHARGIVDRLLAERDELVAALRCIDAALNQNKTFPADVELARAECRAALERVK